MKVEQKLQEMGLELPELPKPNGLYAPSRRVGESDLYCRSDAGHPWSYRWWALWGDLTIEDGQRSAQICALNILSVLKRNWAIWISKTVCTDYQLCALRQGIWKSASGHRRRASRLFRDLYGEAGIAARLAIGANELPGAAPPKYWLWWKQRRTDTGQEPAKNNELVIVYKNQAAPWYIFYKI